MYIFCILSGPQIK